MVAVNDRLYVLGGQQVAAPAALDTVYYAEPDPGTGAIGAGGWMATTALPHKTFGHMVTTWGDRIYVLGGTLDGVTFYPYVNYATPLTSTGAIAPGGWMTTTNMKHNIYGGAAVAVYGEMFTTGGAQNNNSTPSNYVGASLIDRDGGVGAWVDTSLIVPERFFHAAVASDDGWLYVIGGAKFGGTPIDIALINRGATAGEDARSYAPKGDFTSSRIDLGQDRTVTRLLWNTFISDTSAMTVALSYRLRPHGGTWDDWQGPYPSASQNGNVTTTLSISTTARHLQYMAFFSTTVTTRTPVLNWVQFEYIVPNPDLQLAKDDAQEKVHLGDVITYTFYYTNASGASAQNAYILETVPDHTTPYGPNAGWEDLGGGQYRYPISGVITASQSGEVTFVVQVDSQVPDGTASIYDYAIIGAQGDDTNPDDNEAEHTTALEWIDLRLTLSDGITITQPGEVLTYTITYTNGGSVAATGSVLTLTIPDHTAPCGDNTGWTPAGGRQYTRNLGAIAPGGPYEVTFTVCVDYSVDPGVTSLEATATIADDGSNGPDPVPADNTDTDTNALSRVDLLAHKTDDRVLVFRDQTLLYTITVTNVGDATLDGMLYLTETLPLNTTYVDAGYGWSGAGQTWTKSMAVNLTPGDSATTYISVHTNPTAPIGPITNTVTAWTPGVLHPDLGTAHDVDIIIMGAPDLVVEISDGVTATQICQVQVYTIQCHNNGNQTATGVMLTATLPASMTYAGSGWQDIGDRCYTHAVPDLEPDADHSVTFSTVLTRPASLSQAMGRSADRVRTTGDRTSRSPDDWPDQIVQTVTIGCAELEDPAGNVATDVNVLRRPDLYVVSITPIPSPSCVNQSTTFRVVIGNDGDAPVANDCCHGFNVDLYVNPGSPPGASQYSNVDVWDWVSNVEAHGSQTVNLPYTFQSTGVFTVYVQANSDRYWDIPESDFDNNTSDPVSVTVVEKCYLIYLPLVTKSFSL
jgi:uncharacterized repeat protein (TIGR01451 family)